MKLLQLRQNAASRTPFLSYHVALVLVALALSAAALPAHDLFLALDTHFRAPWSTARVRVLNGTFTTSEGAVARGRLLDLTLVSGGQRRPLDRALWDSAGPTLSVVHVPLGEPGTYVLGASLTPRQITLSGKDFTGYLRDEGILAVLARRRAAGESDSSARERYSKHVKALLQVGSRRTADYSTILGYPAELVPLENPFERRRGSLLRVRALVDGQPSAGTVLIAGGRTRSGTRLREQRVTSGASGVGTFRLSQRGRWYVKFIHMAPVAEDSVNYESKWATLTFEVR